MTDLQLFDSKGNFQMPDDAAIAALDPATRELFKAVQTAAQELVVVNAELKAAEQKVRDLMAEHAEADKDLRTLRPSVSLVDAARIWILSQRLQG